MKGTIQFQQNTQYYIDLFNRRADDNDYFSAFSSLKYALKIAKTAEEKGEVLLNMAQGYGEIGWFDRSNEYYHRVLSMGLKKTECYLGLAQTSYCLGDMESVKQNVDKMLDSNEQLALDLGGDFIGEVLSQMKEDESDDKYQVAYSKDREYAEVASHFLANKLTNKAIEYYTKISKEYKDYLSISNELVLCYLMKKEIDKALDKCLEILEIKENAVTLCNLAYCYREKKQYELVEEVLNKVENLTDIASYEYPKIITCMCDFSRDKQVLSFTKKMLQGKPYGQLFLYILAIAHYNQKEYDSATKAFNNLLQLNGEDGIVKYYLKQVSMVKDGKIPFERLPYYPQPPYNEIIKRIKYFDSFINEGDLEKLTISDSYERECLRLTFIYGERELCAKCVNKLVQSELSIKDELLNEITFYGEATDSIRGIIFQYFIEKGKRIIPTIVDYKYKEVEIHYPKKIDKLDKPFKMGFSLAYSILTFSTAPDKLLIKLSKLTDKAYKIYRERELNFHNERAIGLVLLNKVKEDNPFIPVLKKEFNVTKSVFTRYNNALFS